MSLDSSLTLSFNAFEQALSLASAPYDSEETFRRSTCGGGSRKLSATPGTLNSETFGVHDSCHRNLGSHAELPIPKFHLLESPYVVRGARPGMDIVPLLLVIRRAITRDLSDAERHNMQRDMYSSFKLPRVTTGMARREGPCRRRGRP